MSKRQAPAGRLQHQDCWICQCYQSNISSRVQALISTTTSSYTQYTPLEKSSTAIKINSCSEGLEQRAWQKCWWGNSSGKTKGRNDMPCSCMAAASLTWDTSGSPALGLLWDDTCSFFCFAASIAAGISWNSLDEAMLGVWLTDSSSLLLLQGALQEFVRARQNEHRGCRRGQTGKEDAPVS